MDKEILVERTKRNVALLKATFNKRIAENKEMRTICLQIFQGLDDKKNRTLLEDSWHIALKDVLG